MNYHNSLLFLVLPVAQSKNMIDRRIIATGLELSE